MIKSQEHILFDNVIVISWVPCRQHCSREDHYTVNDKIPSMNNNHQRRNYRGGLGVATLTHFVGGLNDALLVTVYSLVPQSRVDLLYCTPNGQYHIYGASIFPSDPRPLKFLVATPTTNFCMLNMHLSLPSVRVSVVQWSDRVTDHQTLEGSSPTWTLEIIFSEDMSLNIQTIFHH